MNAGAARAIEAAHPRAWLLMLVGLLVLMMLAERAQAQATCAATPTANCVFSGAINDYWQGSGNAAATATSVTLGARRAAGGAGATIAVGDLVVLIQMQDADVNVTNTNAYGSGVAGNNGTGSTALNSAGRYQFVRATSAVGAGGGALTFTPALSFALRTRDNSGSGTAGSARWQAIRAPACATASVSNVTAPDWNGRTGGVVALDVLGTLTLGGATAINVAGMGFRGGAGRQEQGGLVGGLNTDYRTIAPAGTTGANGSKGEGIAGTPRYVNNVITFNGAPVLLDTGVEGYQNGSFARGAPGNAGGGGTDGRPAVAFAGGNDENSGGGGGSNYGSGSVGGNTWNSNLAVGGRGGFGYAASLAMSTVFLGGGGGAGTSNNATGDAATYANPPGIACTTAASAALCSSGARGGGIVIVRAGNVGGTGLIDARGAAAYNVDNDGGGGGGGGGSVVLQTLSGGSANINVSGGNGGNARRNTNVLTERHGPGGGGGGGFVAFSPAAGFAVGATFAGGISGLTSNGDSYGTAAATGGLSAFNTPSVPGVAPTAFCPSAVKAVRLFTDNGAAGFVNPGDVIEYTVIFRNGTGAAIPGFNITDTLPAGLTFVPGSLAVTPSGGAAAAANAGYNGAGTNTLLSAAISLPAGGVIQATLRATVNPGPLPATVCGNITNQATGTTLGATDNADATQNSNGLPPGTYITQSPAFPIGGATDATGFVDSCPPTITKLTTLISDPVNGTTNPKRIPGAIVEYTVLVSNPGVAMTANSVQVIDPLDASTALVVTDIAGAGSGPVAFTQGAVSSTLTYTYTNAASATDDLEYFNATSGGARITALTPNASGCDPAVRRIEVYPKGTFADGTGAGTDPSFQLRFRVCIR